MSEKFCCAACFDDPGLTRSIIPKVVADRGSDPSDGKCGYCETQTHLLVSPSALSQWFEMVIDCYVEDDSGRPLVSWLRKDWGLFGHQIMDDAHAKELLADILNDGEIVRRNFSPIEILSKESPQRWDDLRDEMMHQNRWFLQEPIDLDRLGELLDQLIVPNDELPPVWFRARLLSDEVAYSLDKMGAPPRHLAGHGRANPAGIRYLYLGSEPGTAVAEVRPHTGEKASVAKFAIPAIRAVDLRNPRGRISPFIMESAEQISRVRGGLPLLERLGEELTKPVQPRSAAFEYIPSQYLCEFIKNRGFQGVVYRSSVSDGINLALFEPDLANGTSVVVSHVDRVSVAISDIF
jgi:hypothetical protein